MDSAGSSRGPLSASRERRKRLIAVFWLTAGYLVAEVIGGLLTHSLALLADAGHMLTDVGGIGLALLAIHFARKPATPERTYGYYRLEILAALANAVVLIGISVLVLYEAWERFRNPPPVASGPMLAVAGVGLVVNVVGVVLLRGDSGSSLNMKGAYFEVLSDALTSVGVIVAAIVMLTTGWMYVDPLLSAGIGLFILPRTWVLVREAVAVLLEGTPSDVNPAALRGTISGVPGVSGVHDLHVWSLTSGVNAMSVHAVLDAGARHEQVRCAIVEAVKSAHKVAHVTVQMEAEKCTDAEVHL